MKINIINILHMKYYSACCKMLNSLFDWNYCGATVCDKCPIYVLVPKYTKQYFEWRKDRYENS